MKSGTWGFSVGAGMGIAFAFVALIIANPAFVSIPADASLSAGTSAGIIAWIDANLGHSVWVFGAVVTLYGFNVTRLSRVLKHEPSEREVVELDQLIDVWTHLFIGVGVIWTAIGMRSALQSALGDPGSELVDSADNVLQKLVDGGILLALTTTIVGGIGGYLMRLIKTMMVGAALHDFYESLARSELRELVGSSRRVEHQLDVLSGYFMQAEPRIEPYPPHFEPAKDTS